MASLPPLDCFQTALVLIPSAEVQYAVNSLRIANEKAYPRWAAQSLRRALADQLQSPFQLSLDKVDTFKQRGYDTVYLTPSGLSAGKDQVYTLWKVVSQTLGYKGRNFVPHLTLGQVDHSDPDPARFLEKARRLSEMGLNWTVDRLVVLLKDEADGGRMKVVDEISLLPSSVKLPPSVPIPDSRRAVTFQGASWVDVPVSSPPCSLSSPKFTIATFNVLHDPAHPLSQRFPALKAALLQSTADVLCLQEVSDELLPLLIDDPAIRTRFQWSSRPSDLPMASERNILVLGPPNLAPSWDSIAIGNKHKHAVVLSVNLLPTGGSADSAPGPLPFALAVIHLSAGSDAKHQEAKQKEFQTLVKHLKHAHSEEQWLIIGDTNFPDHFDPSFGGVSDVWLALHGNTGVSGATFDPSQNALAMATAKTDQIPHRYDRVYLSRGGPLTPASMTVIRPSEPPSDHWILEASFELHQNDRQALSASQPTPALAFVPPPSSHVHHSASDVAGSDDVDIVLRSQNSIPSTEERIRKRTALNAICRVLGAVPSTLADFSTEITPPNATSAPAGLRLIAMAVGSSPLDADLAGSDLDCLVVGNISAPTFWNVARSKLASESRRQTSGPGGADPELVLKRHVRDAVVPMMELLYDGLKVDMQYCPASNVVESWDRLALLPPDDPIFSLPASTLRPLNACRDNLWLWSNVLSPAFRSALRYLKIFAHRHGIFGSRIGYLGGVHLTLLLAKVAFTAKAPDSEPSSSSLLKTFFQVYATFDWSKDILALGVRPSGYRRESREPMVILSIERPVMNVAASATHHTARTISTTLKVAHDRLLNGASWTVLLDRSSDHPSPRDVFIRQYSSYVKIGLDIWRGSGTAGRALVGFVESRLPLLLINLYNASASVQAQLWPVRLTEFQGTESTLQGFYLVGLAVFGEDAVPLQVLSHIEDGITRSTYYNPENAYLSITLLSQGELPAQLFEDKHEWSDGGIDLEDSTDAQEPEVVDEDGRTPEPPVVDNDVARAGATPRAPGGKLRTSADVYNRLRWDPALDQDDYVIGYEDRFEGVKETDIHSWKRDVEDEAFVPFHRVVYFRRKSDGVRIWDRKSRTDLVFGSGHVS